MMNSDSRTFFETEVDAELEYARQKHKGYWPSDAVHAAAIVSEEAGKLIQAANDFNANNPEAAARMKRMAARVTAMALKFSCNLEGYLLPGSGSVQQNASEHMLQQVYDLCQNTRQKRGIWKIMDECRQILAELQKTAPEIVDSRYSSIEAWIAQIDIFLGQLCEILEIEQPCDCRILRLPRPWPGKYPEEHFDPQTCPLLEDTK